MTKIKNILYIYIYIYGCIFEEVIFPQVTSWSQTTFDQVSYGENSSHYNFCPRFSKEYERKMKRAQLKHGVFES